MRGRRPSGLERLLLAATLLPALLAFATGSASAGTLHGTVLGDTGGSPAPLVGAVVTALDAASGDEVAVTLTQPDGGYALPLPDGAYDVEFRPPAGSVYAPDLVPDITVAGDTTLDELLVVASTGGNELATLTGSVHAADGTPAQGVTLYLSCEDAGARLTRPLGADATFGFAMRPSTCTLEVQPGTSQLAGMPSDFMVTTDSFALSGNRVLDLTLPGVTHRLTVHAHRTDGEPLPAGSRVDGDSQLAPFEIAAGLTATANSHASAAADANGDATMTLLAGNWARASMSGSTLGPASVSPFDADAAVDLTYEPPQFVSVSGTIRYADGTPAQGVVLFESSTGGARETRPLGPEASFAFVVPPGQFSLQVNRGSATLASLPPSFMVTTAFDAEQDRVLDIRLPGMMHTLTVHAHAQDGSPDPFAGVTATSQLHPFEIAPGIFAQGSSTATAGTDATGTASAQLWEGASASASIGAHGPWGSGQAGTGPFDADASVDVEVTRQYQVSGAVTDAAGNPLIGAMLFLNGPVGFAKQLRGGAYAVFGPSGHYEVELNGNGVQFPGLPRRFDVRTAFDLTEDVVHDLVLPAQVPRLTVRVAGPDGAPIAGAAVTVEGRLAPYAPSPGLIAEGSTGGDATTDTAGLATIPLFPTQGSGGQVTATGYRAVSFAVPPLDHDATLSIRLVPPNNPPVAALSAPSEAYRGDPVRFDASASVDPDGPLADYAWDLDGDGSFETDSGTTPTVTREFATLGPHAVRVRVTDPAGASDTASATVTIANHPPLARFSFTPAQPRTLDDVSFSTTSTDPDGTIVRQEWDLDGDGTYETQQAGTRAVRRMYSRAGTYDVSLRVTDDAGATTVLTLPVVVACRVFVRALGICAL